MHSHITIKGDGMRTHIDNTTDYCGNAIYRGDTLSMLLTEEGYVTFANDSTPVYHYYLKDHLGSIRVVFDQSGAVEQRNDHYPSGTKY